MSKAKLFVSAAVAVVVAASNVSSVYAWHPKGEIKKYVQNQTTGSVLSDGESAADSISAKPGDILKYVITIKNTAAPAQKQYNDLAFIKMTDTLPAGVELVSNASQRTITENLGLLTPGKSVTKEYLVKVVSTTDGQVIDNKACFTGDSVVHDNPQKGCDCAEFKVNVPPAEEPPVEEPPVDEPKKPEEPKEVLGEQTPAVLPSTGIESVLSMTGVGALTYAVGNYIQSRRRK